MRNNYKTNIILEKIKKFVVSMAFWKSILAVLAGSGIGYLYYYFIGCFSSKSSITSSLLGCIILGGVIGLFIIIVIVVEAKANK